MDRKQAEFNVLAALSLIQQLVGTGPSENSQRRDADTLQTDTLAEVANLLGSGPREFMDRRGARQTDAGLTLDGLSELKGVGPVQDSAQFVSSSKFNTKTSEKEEATCTPRSKIEQAQALDSTINSPSVS
ncbi:hypothetical protein ScalyP_jg690 [Parmales sp. scaly parma]|nr:hypothetical protein ScalyP_jg690 [Parmales sp. scaly parma]